MAVLIFSTAYSAFFSCTTSLGVTRPTATREMIRSRSPVEATASALLSREPWIPDTICSGVPNSHTSYIVGMPME